MPPGLSALWQTSFPEAARVADAAARFPRFLDPANGVAHPGAERDPYETGPVPMLHISPGVLRIEVADLGKRAAAEERARSPERKDLNTQDLMIRQGKLIRAWLSTLALLDPAVLDAPGWGDWRADRDRQLTRLAEQVKIPLLVRWSERVITEWSRKSRARMVRTLAELDYSEIVKSGRVPCMLTLTLPDAWLEVAPSGKEFKRFMAMLRKRWERAWDEPLTGIWKLEFQRRGAPHLHVFTAMPLGMHAGAGRKARDERYRAAAGDGLQLVSWLKVAWADIVAHPDAEQRRKHEGAGTRVDIAEGLRMTDPKRVAVYFTKHGLFRDKEYQNTVPPAWRKPGSGPGRFWGYWRLRKCTRAVELTFDERLQVARVMRRYGRAGAPRGAHAPVRTVERDVPRGVDPATGCRKFRKVKRRPPDRLSSCSGFLCVNDGPRLAEVLSRVVQAGSWSGGDGFASWHREVSGERT